MGDISSFKTVNPCVQGFTNYFDLKDKLGYTIDCVWTLNSVTKLASYLAAAVVQGAGTVVTATDIVVATAHGFVTGQKVQVSSSTTLPTGLSATTDYWIIAVDANNLAFATTLANADAGTKIDITASGTGTLTIANSLLFLSASEVSTANDTVALRGHGLTTGEVCTLTTSSALPTGLATSTTYYIIKVDADTIAFASSLVNANAGTKIDITAVGTGTQTIVLTALASATVKTEKSNDNVTYFAEETAVNITAAGNNFFGKGPIYYRYVKMTVAIASGNIAFAANLCSK